MKDLAPKIGGLEHNMFINQPTQEKSNNQKLEELWSTLCAVDPVYGKIREEIINQQLDPQCALDVIRAINRLTPKQNGTGWGRVVIEMQDCIISKLQTNMTYPPTPKAKSKTATRI